MATPHLCTVLGRQACHCSTYGIFQRLPFAVEKDSNSSGMPTPWLNLSEPLNDLTHDFSCLQDWRLFVSDLKPDSRLCSCFQDSTSSTEDKCYLYSRLHGVVYSISGSKNDTPLLASQVTAPLVINDNCYDVSSLDEMRPSISCSVSCSVGSLSQSFISQMPPLSSQILLSHCILKFTPRGSPIFLVRIYLC